MSKWRVLAMVVAVLGLTTGCGCEQIEAGNVGVVKHFGAVKPDVLSEGFHWISVFDSVIEVGTQTWAQTAEATGASKDLQTVHTKVTVQWSPLPDKCVCLVQKFGAGDGAWSGGILEPAIQEVVKAVSARYTAEQLITHRSEVKKGIEEELNVFVQKTVDSRGCQGAVRIANVAVTNFDFSKEFNQSIEAKVKAEQDALRAENEKRTRVTQAEAAAKEQTLAADAKAYTISAESKERAAAIERESKALEANPSLVQLRIAEKWDGKLPTTMAGGVPLLQLKSQP